MEKIASLARRSTIYMFSTHTLLNERGEEVAHLVGPTDCNGFFPLHEEWQRLAEHTRLFYDALTPYELTAINERHKARLEHDQEIANQSHSEKARTPQRGFVYVLKGGPYYKIGCTSRPEGRFNEIQPKLPFETEVVCLIEANDMTALEKSLHHEFRSKRCNGEWFELNSYDIEYLKALVETNENNPS